MDTSKLRATTTELIGPQLGRLQTTAMVMGVLGIALSIGGYLLNGLQQFMASYLWCFAFWFGVTLGSLILLMIHHVVGGGWSFTIRRFLEAGSKLWWLALLFFIPIAVLAPEIYPWLKGPDVHEIAKLKGVWLNYPAWIGRACVYFVIWAFFSWKVNQLGAKQEAAGPDAVAASDAANRVSAFGILVYAVSITFASVDWFMSITPMWTSTMFSLIVMVSQGLSTLALMLFLLRGLGRGVPLVQELPSGLFRDLGNFLLTFIMLWAYMSFSQYLITYSGNTSEEVTWYIQRNQGGWGIVSLSLIFIHFALPFLVLVIGSNVKRNINKLGLVAGYILLMRFIDLWWWITPTYRKSVSVTPADLGLLLLLGGIWLWCWAQNVKGKSILPMHDARVEAHMHEVVAHG